MNGETVVQYNSTTFEIIEQFIQSKSGHLEDCEDQIFFNDYFAVVIDGATSKSGLLQGNKADGQIASQLVKDAFSQLTPYATAREATNLATIKIREYYQKVGIDRDVEINPSNRIAACFVALSFARKECWLVGDCQCFIDSQKISNEKRVDKLLAEVRAMFLESEIIRGKSMSQLRYNDTGRDFILPLLERQSYFQNNPSLGDNWYPVVDGFDVPNEGILTFPLSDNARFVVLASDGYPSLQNTLSESEFLLHQLLEKDPLLFRECKMTKGLVNSQVSYDDRAYLRILVHT